MMGGDYESGEHCTHGESRPEHFSVKTISLTTFAGPAIPPNPVNRRPNAAWGHYLSTFDTAWERKLMQKIHRLTDN
jgi:hypothetical protein